MKFYFSVRFLFSAILNFFMVSEQDLWFFFKTTGRISCAAIEDHLKDVIDVGSKISTPANYSDDTNTSQRLSSVLLNEFNYLS
jgi:hypothetical protein